MKNFILTTTKILSHNFLVVLHTVLLAIVAFLMIADMAITWAQPQTYDGWTHLISAKQYSIALSQGNVPVVWVDGVANYGMPLGIIAHQLPNYLVGLVDWLSGSLLFSYLFVWWLVTFLTAVAVYKWLGIHTNSWPALAGSILFMLSPYRILNIWVRAALPEYFAMLWVVLLLIATELLVQNHRKKAWALIAVSFFCLVLTHPMLLLIGGMLLGSYWLKLLSVTKNKVAFLLITVSAAAIGLLMSSFYLIPLNTEMKFMHYGYNDPTTKNFPFLPLQNFYAEKWAYSDPISIGIPLDRPQLGSVELMILTIGLVYFSIDFSKTKSKHSQLGLWFIAVSILLMVLTHKISEPLFQNIQVLAKLQFPWRILSVISLIPPMIAALLIQKVRKQHVLASCCILVVCLLRFPQLYGKNYIQFPAQRYEFTQTNVHSVIMNPIWSSNSLDYPVKTERRALVEGQGEISVLADSAVYREYRVSAQTDARLVEYTFFYPGWTITLNGQPIETEYQDPLYRGLMTLRLPPGEHHLTFSFEMTRVRLLSWMISLSAATLFLAVLSPIGSKLLQRASQLRQLSPLFR